MSIADQRSVVAWTMCWQLSRIGTSTRAHASLQLAGWPELQSSDGSSQQAALTCAEQD